MVFNEECVNMAEFSVVIETTVLEKLLSLERLL